MIEAKLSQANGRLKAAKVGVSIEVVGNRLYLRATFPPRPGAKKSKPYQQRLALGFHANPSGLSMAEKEARKVGALLDCKEFDWTPYIAPLSEKVVCAAEAIAAAGERYLQEGGRFDTWRGDYLKILKNLEQDKPVTSESLEVCVLATQPNSKSRKRACMAIGYLARFLGVDYDPSRLAGNYSPQCVEPRDIPSDLLIAECYYSLKNPAWQWFYGVLATYGLRPHEVFRLDFDQLSNGSKIVDVLFNTKTGKRRVWPFYPEWFEQFRLTDVRVPPINLDRSNEAIGRAATSYFWQKIPFNLYDLRHAWSIRTLEFGFPSELAAQQQGHSHATHSRIYHRWITEGTHQRAFDLVLNNPSRPLVPLLQRDS